MLLFIAAILIYHFNLGLFWYAGAGIIYAMHLYLNYEWKRDIPHVDPIKMEEVLLRLHNAQLQQTYEAGTKTVKQVEAVLEKTTLLTSDLESAIRRMEYRQKSSHGCT